MNLKDYKSRRKNVSDLITKIKDANEKKKKDYTDHRIYKYTKDKTGNAFSIIRFLPSTTDLPPVISTFSHGFKYRGRWFIDDCPTTIGQKCPVCESNNYFWREEATESEKNEGRQRARKKKYYSNIYIIKDSANPDLEGKVMIWEFGQKVYEKIMAKLQPEFEGENPVDIFDIFEGSNFKLKIKTVAGYSNYDGCEFSTSGPLFEDEEKLEEVFKNIYDLSEFINPARYKSYSELKDKLESIVGNSHAPATIEEREKNESSKTTSKTTSKNNKNDDEDDEVTTSEKEDDEFWSDLDEEK